MDIRQVGPGFNRQDTRAQRGPGRRLGAGLLAACILVSLCCGPAPQKSSERLRVVTTLGILADWARQVGGDRVEVTSLLTGNESPHTYEVKPADVKTIADARILFRVGLGMEDWLDPAVENAGNTRLVVIDAADGITDVIVDEGLQPKSEVRDQKSEVRRAEADTLARSEARSADPEFNHKDTKTPRFPNEGGTDESLAPVPRPLTPAMGNPHIWLDPEYAKSGIENLVRELVKLDPKGESLYRKREAAYFVQIDSLSQAIKAQVATLQDRRFISFHDAWPYFARRFGLDIVATVEPIPGQEPSAKDLARLVDRIRSEHIKVITTEPQLPSALPDMLARETGAKVVSLNPLESEGGYIAALGASTRVLIDALR